MRLKLFKPKSENRLPLILTLITVVILSGGFAAGYYKHSLGETAGARDGDFAAGYEAARAKLKNANNFLIPPGFGNSLSGTIKNIDGEKIIIITPPANPLDDDGLKERAVLITDKTQIIINKIKTADDLAAEKAAREKEREEIKKQLAASAAGKQLLAADKQIEDLNGKINELRAMINSLEKENGVAELWRRLKDPVMVMPMMALPKETSGQISDIKPGYSIFVTAEGNIAQKPEFTALKIVVSENQAGPVIMPAPAPGLLPASPYPAP